MLYANRITQNVEPDKFMNLGNNYYYYNYDIKSEVVTVHYEDEDKEETQYNFVQVKLYGKPDYERCVKAVIRAYVDANSEFDLINSYNSYQLDIDSTDNQYEEYLQLIKDIKENVKKDFNKKDFNKSVESTVSSKPKQVDILRLLSMTINTMSLTDQQSLGVKSLYPNWEDFIGKELTKDMKVQYGDKLFKVVQTHTAQSGWEPSIDTAALFTEIVEDHAGTLEDPIPYPSDGNMIIYNGKYYIENNIVYLCIRDSQQPLYTALSTVIDNYVQVVE